MSDLADQTLAKRRLDIKRRELVLSIDRLEVHLLEIESEQQRIVVVRSGLEKALQEVERQLEPLRDIQI